MIPETYLGYIDHSAARFARRASFTDREHPLRIPSPHILAENVLGTGSRARALWHEVLLPHLKDAIALKLSGHLLRTGAMAGAFGEYLGLSVKEADRLRFKGLVHDLGKTEKTIVEGKEVFTFEKMLKCPSKLSPSQREIMDRHPEIGAEMLADLPLDIVYAVMHHHDDDIDDSTKEGRDTLITAFTDVYDATLGKNCFRPYRPGTAIDMRRVFCEEADRKFSTYPIYRQFRQWEALNSP